MVAHTFDEAFSQVKDLVQTFQAHEADFLASDYNEARARDGLINPFWMALGWDVRHETQKNPREQEVTVEKTVNVEGRGKRADYSFTVAPNFRDVRFFVEAKKPSGQLSNAQDYFQTVRYGWNAHTPVAVLTDFVEFHILDCRYKPDVAVVLQYAALEKFHYTDYADEEKFRSIYHLFARDAVAGGALERYAATLPKPGRRMQQQALFARGAYQSVDESFLQELDTYRAQLADTFKQANPQLDSAQLTEITQRTLDRLVFMRFLEDKLIEQDELIEPLAMSAHSWAEFVKLSARLNGVYNGIIFRRHDILDAPTFRVDERVFQSICHDLSHVRSVYAFHLIPIHILGSIYERFLGKTIEAGAGGAAVVDKPEVRKAGGVYYTPEYIVRYIVAQTVGQLIAGKTPEQIRALRFADIACGSGSFLLGVYDLLLRYHTTYYNRNKRTHAEGVKAGCLDAGDGALRLSLLQKRTILLNNIYGVDVDAQAVEVAQLSLYLKLLEEETTATAHAQQLALRAALLPSLGDNIKSGNSLVGLDITSGRLFDKEEELKLNPMDFKDEFASIMRAGGFDAIVGNPPYIRMESFKNLKSYLKANYAAHDERADLYAYFIERAHKLLKEGGRFGMIISNKFLRANYGKPLRDYLSHNASIERIVDFAGLPVFIGATVRTIVLLTSRQLNGRHAMLYTPPLTAEKFSALANGTTFVEQAIEGETYEVALSALEQTVWSFGKRVEEDLMNTLKARGQPLSEYCNGQICMGVKSGLTEAFVIDAQKRAEIIAENPAADEIIKPLLNGRDVRRYEIEPKGIYLIYTYHDVNIRKYPAVEKHLRPYKQRLENRATRQAWYELQQPQLRFAPFMDAPKIIFPDIATTPRFALDEIGFYGSNTTYFIPRTDLYLLGLLNSRLGFFYFAQTCAGLEGKNETYLRFFGQYLEGFPVRLINFSDPAEKKQHDDVATLVSQMMAAKRELAGAATERARALYERKCAALDRQIDELVYALYGLTAAEVALVETA